MNEFRKSYLEQEALSGVPDMGIALLNVQVENHQRDLLAAEAEVAAATLEIVHSGRFEPTARYQRACTEWYRAESCLLVLVELMTSQISEHRVWCARELGVSDE